MSRDPTPSSVTLRRFPRVSGDEPSPVHRLNVRRVFSPRERG